MKSGIICQVGLVRQNGGLQKSMKSVFAITFELSNVIIFDLGRNFRKYYQVSQEKYPLLTGNRNKTIRKPKRPAFSSCSGLWTGTRGHFGRSCVCNQKMKPTKVGGPSQIAANVIKMMGKNAEWLWQITMNIWSEKKFQKI